MNRLYRFGLFELDEKTGELRRQGRRLPLQDQPLQVLLMILARPGELVTRAEIQQRIWSDGTFVDFDHAVNTAINKIRDALGDSASNPRFVETLARRGYRFIASVEVQDTASPGPSAGAAPKPVLAPPDQAHSVADLSAPFSERFLTQPHEVPTAPHRAVQVLLALLQLMYLIFYVVSLARFKDVERVVREGMLPGFWLMVLVIVTAACGIPIRLYLLSSLLFRSPRFRENFLKIFPALFLLDELWSLAPFLLLDQIGFGLALAATAALLYSPFAQRSLVLMSSRPTVVSR